MQRPEWRALRDAYGLRFKATRAYTPTFMYRALEDGEADVITAFSSDGAWPETTSPACRIPAEPHRPTTPWCWSRRNERGDARLRAALTPLIGAIDPAQMRAPMRP